MSHKRAATRTHHEIQPHFPRGCPIYFDVADCKRCRSFESRSHRCSKAWDEAELAEWATPVAGLNVRPSHISSAEYYSLPVENYRSYPVYMPGREPEGYWETLQHIGPKSLIDVRTLHTPADWIRAGQRVFDEATAPSMITFDPKLIAQVRSRQFMESQGAPHSLTARWTSSAGCPRKRESRSPLLIAARAMCCIARIVPRPRCSGAHRCDTHHPVSVPQRATPIFSSAQSCARRICSILHGR